MVAIKESLVLPKSENAKQSTLDTNKEGHSERNLIDQFEKKSINTTPNSLSKINELQVENTNKVLTLSKINSSI